MTKLKTTDKTDFYVGLLQFTVVIMAFFEGNYFLAILFFFNGIIFLSKGVSKKQ